jgi:glycerol uptake facilitator-like aquaporin
VILAQLTAGMVAATVVKFILPGREILFAVSLGPGVTVIQGLFIEMILTFELVFTILMLAAEVRNGPISKYVLESLPLKRRKLKLPLSHPLGSALRYSSDTW